MPCPTGAARASAAQAAVVLLLLVALVGLWLFLLVELVPFAPPPRLR